MFNAVSFIKANNQQKLIVYNVPQKQAIDIIKGRNYLFAGDADLLADDFVRNFHIKPARVLNRIESASVLKNYFEQYKVLENKKVEINDFQDKAEAFAVINESIEYYKQKFPKQQ